MTVDSKCHLNGSVAVADAVKCFVYFEAVAKKNPNTNKYSVIVSSLTSVF